MNRSHSRNAVPIVAFVCVIMCFAFGSRLPTVHAQGSAAGSKAPLDLQKLDQIMESMVDELYARASTSGAKGLQTKYVRFEGVGWESSEGVIAGNSTLGALLQQRLAAALSRKSVVLSPDESDVAKGFFGTVVRGGFGVLKSAVRVTLRMVDGNTGNVLSEVNREFGLGVLPGLGQPDIEPPNTAEAKELGALIKRVAGGVKSDFKLRVSTDQGSFGTYTEGEKLTIILEAEKDCYVRVYHVSWQERKLTLIFPNKTEQDGVLKAGEVRRIPGEFFKYSFEVSKPCGVDAIVAVASLEPFSDEGQVEAQWSGPSESGGNAETGSEAGDTTQVQSELGDTTQTPTEKGIERVGNYLEKSNLDEGGLQDVVAKGLIIKEEDGAGQQSPGAGVSDARFLKFMPPELGPGTARATCYFVTVQRLF